MADNVAQSIKDLQKDLAALDKQLLSNNANWDKLGQTIVDSMKRGGLGLDDLFSKMKGQKDVLKLRAIIDRDALMDDVKKLQTAVDKGVKSVKVGGVEITGQKQIKQALDGYKAQLKLVPKTLAEAYDYAVKIANTLSGSKSKEGTAWSRARADEMNASKKAIDDVTRTEGRLLKLEQELSRYKEGGSRWKNVKSQIEAANKELEVYREKLKLLASRGKSALDANTGTVGFSKKTKQLIQEGRDATRESERLAKVKQKDAEWQEQQRRNTEAQFVANGKAIEQQRKLADQIDILTRKRQALAKYTTDSSVAFDSRNYPLASAYQKQIEDLIRLRQQLDRQFSGSMKAGDLAFADTKTLRDQEEAQKRITAEQKQRDKERADAARQRAAIERKADSESLANQRRQIQIKAQMSAIDKARNSDRDVFSRRAKAQVAEENAEYKRLSAELTRLIARQKELNAISQGSGSRARGRLQTYEITASEQALRRYEEAWRRVNGEQKSSDDNMRKMLSTVSRLASAFGVAFSVQGLVNFGKKLVETRGEFEMQFVAMKSIIGDVDAATKIWNQTLQQSLQSPKTFKELTMYTKQLAAYRIETDKLFDTTKRLADVSAGLGVGMGRLILAYGQVKAANYLRASEVRQFTEAGVNIYGELAKYFSEIEGRAVGTAEVVERVSKRMVLFSDVEKIFQRMTDEGGTFFNMQEIQADTVLGQINKLHDAYDQMLNTIGQANDGTIRKWIGILNDLVRNWQNVAFVLKGNVNWITIIGAALYALSRNYLKGATTQTLWFAKSMGLSSKTLLKNTADVKIFSKALGDFTLRQRMAIVATRTFQGALGALGRVAKAIWPLVVFEGAVLLIERLTRASRELKRFREELEAVTSENVGRMNEEISGYDALIKKLQKTNEGTAARKEILDEISSRYGKYLDFIVTEKTTVEELAGAYDNVVSSIRNYTAEKIREEQQQKLEKGIYDEYQDLVDSLTGKRIADAQGKQFKITKEQAKNIAKLIQQSLDVYGVVDIQQILETYFGKALGLTSAGGDNTGIGNLIRSYIGEYKSLNQELQDIRNDIEGQTPVFSSDAEYEDYKKRVQAANAELAEQAKRNKQINNLIKQNNKEQWQADDALSKQRIANSEAELRIRRKYNLITQKEYESSLARLNGQLDDYETDYNRRLKKSLQSMSSFGPFWLTLDKDARDMYNYVVSTEDALQQGTEQRNKQLKESYKGLKDSLKQYQSALAAGGDKDALNKNITWTKLMIKAIELAAKLRGIDLTDTKKTGTGVQKESVSAMISLIKEMNSEYEKLSKSAYGFAKSQDKVTDSFRESFEQIFRVRGGKGTYINYDDIDFTNKAGAAKALQAVFDQIENAKAWGKFAKNAKDEMLKAISGLEVEADIEVKTRIREDFGRQMEDAFSDFQLTLDLEKLQLPSGLLKNMFDIDGTDLAAMRQKLEDLSKDLTDENGVMTGDNLKLYEQWLKKLDDEERKLQQQRLKDYSKYLEYQLSDRAKLEMEYVRKVAEVQSEIAYDDTTRQRILDGLRKEYDEKLAKQDWEDFKGSEMYVEMMEDLTKQGTAALEEMRKKLLEVRDNAENLSPRALKEVIKALEKIDETIYGRMSPFQAVRELRKEVDDAMNKNGVSDISEAFRRDASAKKKYEERRKVHEEIEENIADRQKEKEILEQIGDSYGDNISIIQKMQKSTRDERIELEKELVKLGEENESNQSRRQDILHQINDLKAEEEQYQKRIELVTKLQSIQEKLANSRYKGISFEELSKMSKEELDAMGLSEEEMKDMGEILKYWKLMRKAEIKALDESKNYLSIIQNIGKNTADMLHTFGAEHNPLSDYWEQATDSAFNYAIQTIDAIKQFKEAKNAMEASGELAKNLMTGNLIKLALQLLGVLIQLINQIGLFRNARINKEIEDQKEKIDQLTMAYERLEKSIERTLSTSEYMADMHQMMVNISEQIEATEQQLALARSRKSVDNDEVRGYEKSLQDLYDQLDDVHQKQIEVFGGVGKDNYRSWAEGFVSAWRDAFLETGDGLDALEDHFDEFLQGWFEKQATMRIAGKMLEPLMNMIDSSVDDGYLTRIELDRIRERASEIFPQINEQLREFYETMGFGDGNGSLSGLAKAISGMTEEQADILAAYWNSVRMYVASMDVNVAAIANALGIGEGSPNTNPMLQQLTIIARNTSSIYTLLDSVVMPGHSKGRSGLKIFLN